MARQLHAGVHKKEEDGALNSGPPRARDVIGEVCARAHRERKPSAALAVKARQSCDGLPKVLVRFQVGWRRVEAPLHGLNDDPRQQACGRIRLAVGLGGKPEQVDGACESGRCAAGVSGRCERLGVMATVPALANLASGPQTDSSHPGAPTASVTPPRSGTVATAEPNKV